MVAEIDNGQWITDNGRNTEEMKYSIIIPVYNRPGELGELLESLCSQTLNRTAAGDFVFEVVVVEDGSAVPCEDVCRAYEQRLPIRYFVKENGGPGPARNFGVERAAGDYVLILDSDVVLPAGYLAAIDAELAARPSDAFGGPDAAHPDFTPVQKAINYAMTSFFTTGGIRGGKKGGARLDRFFPRSFNMGIRREVYTALGGFARMRFGEDVDFSYRIVEGGHTSRLFPDAWVWHKRRANFRQFFKQVHNSGIARINLTKRHPGTLKLVHMLPAVFTVGVALCLAALLVGLTGGGLTGWAAPWLWLLVIGLCPLLLFSLIILIDATARNRSLHVGLLSVVASFIQLTGYGSGFLRSWWQRCILGRDEFEAFKKNFYK